MIGNGDGGLAAAQSSTLKRINMRRFLDELRKRGPSTRAELSRATGVAAPTSSSVIADLVATGLLEQAEDRLTGKGRPGKLFRLATDNVFIVGMTLGPEESVIAPAGLNGKARPAVAERFATPNTYNTLLETIVDRVDRIRRGRPGSYLGFAVSLPGLVDERAGRVALSPNVHFMDGRNVGGDLSELLKMDVLCIQEEHALCLAEQNLGQAKGLFDYAVLDITYGMGMGVVCGGRYVTGRDGFAGEIGHVTADPNGTMCGCGNRGCFETVATDIAFLNSVRARLGKTIGFDELSYLMNHELIDVHQEIESTLRYLAVAVAAVVNLFNPDAIFVSSRLFDLRPEFLNELVMRTAERSLAPSREVTILPSRANRLDGVLAGLLDHVFARVGPKLT